MKLNVRTVLGIAVVIAAVILASACQTKPKATTRHSWEMSQTDLVVEEGHVMPVDGRNRTWFLQKPLDSQPDEKLPVAIILHGHGKSGRVMQGYIGEERVVETRFIAVYPNGVDKTWNLGNGCCWPLAGTGIDDLKFLDAIIDHLVTRGDVDPERISMMGGSLGGIQSYRYACVHGDRLSAVGSVAGTHIENCGPNEPLPTMQIHSLTDESIAYDGGRTSTEWLLQMNFPAVVPTLMDWASAGDCPEGLGVNVRPLLDNATVTEWDCGGVVTRLDTLTWGGHAWPIVGEYVMADHMLDFLLQYGAESVTEFEPAPDVGHNPPLIHLNGTDLTMRPSNTAAFLDWVMTTPDGEVITFDPPGTDGVWSYPVPATSGSGVYVITQRREFEEIVDTIEVNLVPNAQVGFSTPTSAPAEVTFTDQSVDYNGTVESVAWDFGALGSFSGPSATVHFDIPGDYTYTQTVTDNQGGVRSVTRTITVPS